MLLIVVWLHALCYCFYFIDCRTVEPVLLERLDSTEQPVTFALPNSFLKVQPTWPVDTDRELFFSFKTKLANCLLMYIGIKSADTYFLLIVIEQGQLKIIHPAENQTENEVYIGKGLNRGFWHNLHLKISANNLKLTVKLDNIRVEQEIRLSVDEVGSKNGIRPESFMYFGGFDGTKKIRFLHFPRFVGCMKNIRFGTAHSKLSHVNSSTFSQLYDGCYDSCEGNALCLSGGLCIDHYSHYSCDCFHTNYEGDHCNDDVLKTVRLRGFEYLSYRMFNWQDRVHSEFTRISIHFKTVFADSVLFYGHGKHPEANYISGAIIDGRVRIKVNFGSEEKFADVGKALNDGHFHNLTVHHDRNVVVVSVDSDDQFTAVLAWDKGGGHHLHLNPDIFFGGLPDVVLNSSGLDTNLNFVGNLRSIYVNTNSIIQELNNGNGHTKHYGILPINFGSSVVEDVPATFSFYTSYVEIAVDTDAALSLMLDFKTRSTFGALVSSEFHAKNSTETGYWMILLDDGFISFVIVEDANDEDSVRSKFNVGKVVNDNLWHSLSVSFSKSLKDVKIIVDYENEKSFTHEVSFVQNDVLRIGGSTDNLKNPGFIGCVRKIYFGSKYVDLRQLDLKPGVSFDGCSFVNPCDNPGACEHGGRCVLSEGQVSCDCKDTGYAGKTCHISLYNRTCEELYISGFRKSGYYKIDIDRNGPFPFSRVYCDMDGKDSATGDTTIVTRIDHNVPPYMEIWSGREKGFMLNITYRDMTPEMLRILIRTSKKCRQTIKYDCFNTPLKLGSNTWFKSSQSEEIVNSLGSYQPKYCKCGEDKSCSGFSSRGRNLCNCDSAADKHFVDDGVYTRYSDLGIIAMYFVPPEELGPDSKSTVTLGPLECIKANPQRHVVKFKSAGYYLKVPGLNDSDVHFSFKTTVDESVLLYQPALYGSTSYFRISLVKGDTILFEYSVNDEHRSTAIVSDEILNKQNWHHIWVDYSDHHVKFAVDSTSKLIDLVEGEIFGPFGCDMYIAGVPSSLRRKHHRDLMDISYDFVGCFRGLLINDVDIDLSKHIPSNSRYVEEGCSSLCVPNPCTNGATCVDHWNDYECICLNKLTQSGKNCEMNLNANSVTFWTANSHYKNVTFGHTDSSLLNEDFMLTFRTYEKDAIILYANDHMNNFIHLHLEDGNTVLLTFNSLRSIFEIKNKISGSFYGQPIQVQVILNGSSTSLIVNGKMESVNQTRKFLTSYFHYPWHKNKNLELTWSPRDSVRREAHNKVFLGNVDKDATVTELPGFVGCIQGFTVGGIPKDLKEMTKDVVGVIAGCHILCDLLPCKNNGLCIQNWRSNSTSCLCSETSYEGEYCDGEVGSGFDGKHYIPYVYQGITESKWNVRFAFSTDASPEKKGFILLRIQFKERRDFLVIFVTKEGYLTVVNRINDKVRSRTAYDHYADGYRHRLSYSYDDDDITFIVDDKRHTSVNDDYEESTVNSKEVISSESRLTSNGTSSATTITIGGIEPDVPLYSNYIGCISNLILNFGSSTLRPLHVLYGYEKQSGADVQKINIKEEKCSGFAPPIVILPDHEIYEIPPEIAADVWIKDPIQKIPLRDPPTTGARIDFSGSAIVAILLSIFLALVLLPIFVYMYRLNRRHRRLKFENDTKFFSKRGSQLRDPRDMIEREEFRPLTDDDHPDVDQPKTSDPPNRNQLRPNDGIEMNPLKSSSSQELEWDPAADNQDLLMTSMFDMNPEAIEERADPDLLTSLPSRVKNLPSAGQPPNKRFSTGSIPRPASMHAPLSTISEEKKPCVAKETPPSVDDENIDGTNEVEVDPTECVSSTSEPNISLFKSSCVPPLPPKTRKPPPLPPKHDEEALPTPSSTSNQSYLSNEPRPNDDLRDEDSTPRGSMNSLSEPLRVDPVVDESDVSESSSPLQDSDEIDRQSFDGDDRSVENHSEIPSNPCADAMEPNDVDHGPEPKISAENLQTVCEEPLKSVAGLIPGRKPFLPFPKLRSKYSKLKARKIAANSTKVCHPLSANHHHPCLPSPQPSFVRDLSNSYSNPLSYLGGPNIDYESDASRRSSIKSVISLD